jgi:hypothetical protein
VRVGIYMPTGQKCRPAKMASGHIYAHWPKMPPGQNGEWAYICPLAKNAARPKWRVGIYMLTGQKCRPAKSASGHIYGDHESSLCRLTPYHKCEWPYSCNYMLTGHFGRPAKSASGHIVANIWPLATIILACVITDCHPVSFPTVN